MKNFTSKLFNFPRTHAFVAIATANIKGNTVAYWMEELKEITIIGKCNCGRCYSIYFEDSKENQLFTHDHPCVTNFGHVFVVLVDKNDGFLQEMEVPQEDYVPYAEEFDSYGEAKSTLPETAEEAHALVKQWFIDEPVVETFKLLIE